MAEIWLIKNRLLNIVDVLDLKAKTVPLSTPERDAKMVANERDVKLSKW
jgi:hypothetical protein